MMRKVLFWVHFFAGLTAGIFIFIMAATGVLLSFEKQIIDLADRDIRSVTVPDEARPRPLRDLLESIRRSGLGEPTAIVLRDEPQAAAQFSIGRGKTAFVGPYSGAILGVSSVRVHEIFSVVERLHRTLGSPIGSKGLGHWLAAASNLLFGALIILGVVLWLPRKWNWNSIGAVLMFRTRLRGRARDWNWHNVIGIWCALPLFIIVLTGVVMSFPWANALLFRLSGSTLPAASGRGDGDPAGRGHTRSEVGQEPDYDQLFASAMTLNPDWHIITLNVTRAANTPVSVSVDTGTGGQPQKRTQYALNRDTAVVVKQIAYKDGSLGQRLRAFVRFGHTGEYGGLAGQAIAGLASLGACVLVYTGLSLAIRRFGAKVNRRRREMSSMSDVRSEQPVG